MDHIPRIPTDDEVESLSVFEFRIAGYFWRHGWDCSIRQIAKICKMSPASVINAANALVARGLAPPHPSSKVSEPPGYVYLISDGAGNYKIGVTGDVKRRQSEIQTSNAACLDLIASIYCEKPASLEQALHRTYRDKHVRAEWFALTQDDVECIKSLSGGER